MPPRKPEPGSTDPSAPAQAGSNRRNFLRTCLAGAALVGCTRTAEPAGGSGPTATAPTSKSRVVIARDAALRGSGKSVDSTELLKLLDRAMQSYYGTDAPLDAWKKLVKPGEVVGLKVNCLAGRGASTHPVLVEVIAERLREAGIKDIVVWDRLARDLESGGFRPDGKRAGVRYIGNDEAGYEGSLAIYGSAGSLISRTLTRTCDAVINLPVLKDHGITGVTLALKNFFGAIHNPNKYHTNAGNPYIADVNMFDPIRRKLRLTIADALTAQYEGGPSYMPQWSWPFNGLLVSNDSVAMDYTGWQIIEAERARRGMKSLEAAKRSPRYIATAADARHRLGTIDPGRIEKVEV